MYGDENLGIEYYYLTRGRDVLMQATYGNGLADTRVLSGRDPDECVIRDEYRAPLVVLQYDVKFS